MKNICFTIALNGYDKTYNDCIESQIKYSRSNDYKHWIIRSTPWKISARQSAWLKVELIRGLLQYGANYIAFFDADCEIRSHTPPFESSFPNAETDLMMALGKSGRLNSGVVFSKNSPALVDFLHLLIAHSDDVMPKADRTNYENGHFIHFGRTYNGLSHLSHTEWNNNSAFDLDSFVQHYSSGELRRMKYPQGKIGKTTPPSYTSRILGVFKKDVSGLPIREFLELAKHHFSPQYQRFLTK